MAGLPVLMNGIKGKGAFYHGKTYHPKRSYVKMKMSISGTFPVIHKEKADLAVGFFFL